MKKILLSLLFYFDLVLLTAQTPSFYLNNGRVWNRTAFTKDAIYFITNSDMTKTDYQGNIKWSILIPDTVHKIIATETCIYGLTSSKVFKFDSAGNELWSKDFSAMIYPATFYPNSLSDLIFDGKYIYLIVIQSQYWTSLFSYPSVLTIDTSGSVIHTIYFSGQNLSGRYLLEPCTNSVEGAWIGFVYGRINSNDIYLVKINGNGDEDSTAKRLHYYFDAATSIHSMISMPDSTTLVLMNSFDDFNDNPGNYISCSKIDNKGNIKWQYHYYDSTLTASGSTGTGVFAVACDSLNNIYMVGTASQYVQNSTQYFGLFAMKLNASGKVILTKFWSIAKPYMLKSIESDNSCCYTNTMQQNLHYLNGHLYLRINYDPNSNYTSKPGMLVFDSLFNNSCYDPDSSINLQNVFAASKDTTAFFPGKPNVISYSPALNTLSFYPSVNQSSNLCLAMDVKSFLSQSELIIYPNPITGHFTISLSKSLVNAELTIFNLIGEKVYSETFSGKEKTVNAKLKEGIYFVQVRDGEGQWTEKVVVE